MRFVTTTTTTMVRTRNQCLRDAIDASFAAEEEDPEWHQQNHEMREEIRQREREEREEAERRHREDSLVDHLGNVNIRRVREVQEWVNDVLQRLNRLVRERLQHWRRLRPPAGEP